MTPTGDTRTLYWLREHPRSLRFTQYDTGNDIWARVPFGDTVIGPFDSVPAVTAWLSRNGDRAATYEIEKEIVLDER